MESKEFLAKNISFFRYITDPDRVFVPKRELYGFIDLSTHNASDSVRLAKLVWDGILEEYKKNERMKPSDGLKLALKFGEHTLREIIKKDKLFSKKGVDLNYVLILFSENKIYVSVFGNSMVVMVRDGKRLDLSEIIRKKGSNILSTYLYSTDKILIGTPKEASRILRKSELSLSAVCDIGVEIVDKDDGGVVFFSDQKEEEIGQIEQGQIIEPVKEETVDESRLKQEEIIEEPQISAEITKEEEKEEIVDTPEEIKEESNVVIAPKNIKKPENIKLSIAKNKAASFIKEKTPIIKAFFNNVFCKIGGLIGKIFSFFRDKIKYLLDKQFGKELWFRRLRQLWSNITYRFNNKSIKGTKIDGYQTVNKRKKLVGYIVVVLAVIGLAYWGYKWTQKQAQIKEAKEEISTILLETEALIIEAERTVMSDSTNSQAKIAQAQLSYSKINNLTLIPDEIKPQIDQMKEKLISADDKVSRKQLLNEDKKNIELFVNAKVNFQENTILADIAYHKSTNGSENLFLLDSGTKTLYKISLKNKSITKVADPATLLKAPISLTTNSLGVYVLDGQEGVLRATVDEQGNSGDITRVSGLEANKISASDIKDFEVWSQERMFSLVPKDGKMYMYSVSKGMYGQATTRFEGDFVTYGNDIFADEINVYGAFTGQQTIKRFKLDRNKNSWTDESLVLEGVYPQITEILYGYSSDKHSFVYIYDQGTQNSVTQTEENRIMLFTKPDDNGMMVLQKQFVYRGSVETVFDDVKNLVVDQQDSYAYVLDGDNVWLVNLKKE